MIRDEIDSAKLPIVAVRFLKGRLNDSLKHKERLILKSSQAQTELEDKAVNDQTGVEAHLNGCLEWLRELSGILSEDSKFCDSDKTVEDQRKRLAVKQIFIGFLAV